MNREDMAPRHLFATLFMFVQGSAFMLNLSSAAGRDAWISILLACCLGIGMFCIYLRLMRRYPRAGLYDLFVLGFGKFVGPAFVFLYMIYFLYLAARDIRDITELIAAGVLIETPGVFIALAFTMLVLFVVSTGIGNILRMSVSYLWIFLSFYGFVLLLILISEEYEWGQLLPLMGDGAGRVFQSSLLETLEFPFGETVVFLAAAGAALTGWKAGKTSAAALGAGGAILAFSSIVQLISLGVSTKARTYFPMASAARNVSIGTFIERVEILLIFVMLLAIVVKVSIFLYAALHGTKYILSNVSGKQMLVPFSVIACLQALLISPNVAVHFQQGIRIISIALHIPMQFGIPSALFATLLLRRKGMNA